VRIGDRLEHVRFIASTLPRFRTTCMDGTRGGEAAARLNPGAGGRRRVNLERDVEERDHYGRLLAYVWAATG